MSPKRKTSRISHCLSLPLYVPRHGMGDTLLLVFFALCVKHISLNTFSHQKLDLPDGYHSFLGRALSKSSVSLFFQIESDKADQDVAVTSCDCIFYSCFTEGKKSIKLHNILATICKIKWYWPHEFSLARLFFKGNLYAA